jgi:hypothetical protein
MGRHGAVWVWAEQVCQVVGGVGTTSSSGGAGESSTDCFGWANHQIIGSGWATRPLLKPAIAVLATFKPDPTCLIYRTCVGWCVCTCAGTETSGRLQHG